MSRRYTLKKRAESQEETRRRITEAVYELHATVGPAETTISEVAERAGVQRLTVYRHFPDEAALIRACSAHFATVNPYPDPTAWVGVADPEARLREALGALYTYYRRTEPVLTNVLRDAPRIPALAEELAEFPVYLEAMGALLAAGWTPHGDPPLLRAATGHALQFSTWRSLAGPGGLGLSDEQAIELMSRLVCCAAGAGDPASRQAAPERTD